MKSLIIGVLGAVFAVSIAASAQAATINVDTPYQFGEPETDCTFTEAINAINDGSDGGGCQNSASEPYGANDTIHLPAGATLEFTYADHFDPVGPTALPTITRSVTIHGHGAVLKRASVNTRGPKEDYDYSYTAPMRFFEIASRFEPWIGDYYNSDFDGSEVLVFWDQTTFEGGNPGCGGGNDAYEVEKVSARRIAYLNERPSNYEVPAFVTFDAPSFDTNDYFNNPCYSGGAGYIWGTGTFVSFHETTFKNNEVDLHRPYYSPLGGAVFIDGGAFSMANFSKSVLTGNKAPAGGAIYARAGVQMSIADSTFARNKAEVLNADDEPWEVTQTADSKMGGAVFTEGPLTVTHSAFFGNEGGIGGALTVRGPSNSIVNTTFFDNFSEFMGGAIAAAPIPYNYRDLNGPSVGLSGSSGGFYRYAQENLSRFGSSPKADLQHLTVVGNSAGAGPETMPAVSVGGGIANLGAGVVSLKNTILTGNAVASGGSGPNCYGAILSYGHNNLNWPDSDGSCAVVLAPAVDPDVSQDPVLKVCNPDGTAAGSAGCDPEATSPMIAAAVSCPSEDQRHTARNTALCTIGAIEVAPLPPAPVEEEPDDGSVLSGAVCGNGSVEDGEECDLGEAHNSDEPNASCRRDCTARRCGDGIVDGNFGEGCDGGATCFECKAQIVPSDACEITEADLMDPTLKTNDDVVARFGYTAVEKCLQVFGGGDSSCALNPAATGEGLGSISFFLIGLVAMIGWRAKAYLVIRS